MATKPPPSPLHEKFIRETEQTIDTKRKKMELLLEEAEALEGEVEEARKLLHFLKTGEATNGRVAADSGLVIPSRPAASTAQLAIVKDQAEEKKEDKPRRATPVVYSDDELLAKLQQLPEQFSTRQALGVVPLSQSTLDRRLHGLVEKGLAKICREKKQMGTKGGHRSAPRLWRVTQVKRNGDTPA